MLKKTVVSNAEKKQKKKLVALESESGSDKEENSEPEEVLLG